MNKKSYLRIILIISLIVQAGWLGAILFNNKAYLFDYKLQAFPDAKGYYELGRNLVNNQTFSRSTEPPLLRDPIRTPGYPLLIALAMAFSMSCSVLLVIIFQVMLYIIGTLLLFKIVKRILNERAAFIAAILMSLDLVSHSSIYQLLTETFFTTTLLLVVWLILKYLDLNGSQNAVFLGLAIALLIYIKPLALYLIFIIPAYLAFSDIRKKRSIKFSVVCFLIVAIMISPWIYRNYKLFDVRKISVIDNINLVFFTAASIYGEGGGIKRDSYRDSIDVRDIISKDFELPTYSRYMNMVYSDYRKYDEQFKKVGMGIIVKNPKGFIKSSVRSVIQSMLSHSVDSQAQMLDKRYTHIGLSNIIKLKTKNILENTKQNALLLNLLFLYEVIFNMLNLVLFVFGVSLLVYMVFIKRIRVIRREYLFLILIFTAYLFIVTASMGAATYYRFRIPNMPFVFIFAAAVIDYSIRFMTVNSITNHTSSRKA